jgi:hypothetical protein
MGWRQHCMVMLANRSNSENFPQLSLWVDVGSTHRDSCVNLIAQWESKCSSEVTFGQIVVEFVQWIDPLIDGSIELNHKSAKYHLSFPNSIGFKFLIHSRFFTFAIWPNSQWISWWKPITFPRVRESFSLLMTRTFNYSRHISSIGNSALTLRLMLALSGQAWVFRINSVSQPVQSIRV